MDGEYIFKINKGTPKTIPMGRLLAYLARVVDLLGDSDGVHFVEIREGSAEAIMNIDAFAQPFIDQRLAQADSDDAPDDVVDAIAEINEMFRADKDDGAILKAANDGSYVPVFKFRGVAAPEPKTYGPYPQATTIDAYLSRAGGKKPRLTLLDPEQKQISAECTEDTLKAIRHHLHEWLRLHGEGKWFRTVSGRWQLRGFNVSHFEPVENESLRGAVERLRAVRTDWERDPDALERAKSMRRDDGEAQ